MFLAALKKWGIGRREIIIGLFFIAALIFTRFYNIDRTARFTEDESSDLVHMQEYILQRRITLVGPISNDNSKVFGSLTYYMLMPFVAIGHFDPISPVYGTAFWGVLTAILLVASVWKINKKYVWLAGLIVVLWHPLVETSRWAWNPHYVTFWIALGIFAYLFKTKVSYFLTGIFLALSFHNHYLAGIATGVFVASVVLLELFKKDWKKAFTLSIGFVLPFIPFVIFDLRHPPGLFFARYLFSGSTPHMTEVTPSEFVAKLLENIHTSFGYLVIPSIGWLLLLVTVILLILERKKLMNWLWIVPVLAQVVICTVLDFFQTRYFLPALPFFLVWLVLPRQGWAKKLAQFGLVLVIISSMSTVIPDLTETKVPPDIYSLRAATQIITDQYHQHSLKNINVAALAGPDTEPLGAKYRNLLQIQSVPVMAESQYDTSENLFIMSTADTQTVDKDSAAARVMFKDAHLDQVFEIPQSQWKVYWYHY